MEDSDWSAGGLLREWNNWTKGTDLSTFEYGPILWRLHMRHQHMCSLSPQKVGSFRNMQVKDQQESLIFRELDSNLSRYFKQLISFISEFPYFRSHIDRIASFSSQTCVFVNHGSFRGRKTRVLFNRSAPAPLPTLAVGVGSILHSYFYN